MRNEFRADTLPTVFIPPGLLAAVRAEKPVSCSGRIGQSHATVFADRFPRGGFCHHTIPAAEGFDGADRDSKGCGYSGVSGILLTHDHDLSFL